MGGGKAADGSSAAEVGIVLGLDVDFFTDIDEERNLNNEAGFHGGRFVNVVGRVALHAFRRFSDGHGHREREFDRDHAAVGNEQGVELALDEVIFHAFDQVLIDHGVLIGIGIEEMVAAAVLVGIFVRGAFEDHSFERVVGGQAEVEDFFGRDAADRHLHVGRHARRRLEFVVDDEANFVVVPDGVSFAEIDDRGAGHGMWGVGLGTLGAERQVRKRISASLGGYPSGDFLVIVASGPNLTEKVSGVDVAVIFEEIHVAAAAEHDVRVEFTTEFGPRFGEDARKVGDVIERIAKGREFVVGEGFVALLAFLDGMEIIAAHGCDEQGGGEGGALFVAEIFDEVEKLAGFVADFFKQLQILACEPVFVIAFAFLIACGASVEEVEKSVVPSHEVRINAKQGFGKWWSISISDCAAGSCW